MANIQRTGAGVFEAAAGLWPGAALEQTYISDRCTRLSS
jgi:hypothetical protein